MTTKEKLINSTMLLVNEYGFQSTSTSKIAKHAGFSEATIYKHFDNKVALLATVYFNIKKDIFNAMRKDLDKIDDVAEMMKQRWFNYLNFFIDNPEKLKFYLQYTNSHYSKLEFFTDEHKESLDGVKSFMAKTAFEIPNEAALAFFTAFLQAPLLELAKMAVVGNIELTEELKEQAYFAIRRIIDIKK